MIISTGTLTRQSLVGQVAIVTGAGGGIGYEAARALRWLGARVVIAEIDRLSGSGAAKRLNAEFGAGSAVFAHTDVGSERSVSALRRAAQRAFGTVDIVINNATVAPIGAVSELPIPNWDKSYRVNLRGPVLLAQAFLPEMLARRKGAFLCVSSTGQAYMAAYEALKAAQVHLGGTLDAELDGSGVHAFTIGPGFVPTDTASAAIPQLAQRMGLDAAALQASLAGYTLSVEAAGAGFAAAAAMAERYGGQEISSGQALADAGIFLEEKPAEAGGAAGALDEQARARAVELAGRARRTLVEQSAGWKQRSIFEYQWMVRHFRKTAGLPVEGWLQELECLETDLAAGRAPQTGAPLENLAKFHASMLEMARGYVKDPVKREEQLAIVAGWLAEVQELQRLLDR